MNSWPTVRKSNSNHVFAWFPVADPIGIWFPTDRSFLRECIYFSSIQCRPKLSLVQLLRFSVFSLSASYAQMWSPEFQLNMCIQIWSYVSSSSRIIWIHDKVYVNINWQNLILHQMLYLSPWVMAFGHMNGIWGGVWEEGIAFLKKSFSNKPVQDF